MRQRASPKYPSRRMVPKVSVSWGPAGRRESAQQLFLLTSVSPGVDEQSESSEESEEEKAPEEDKEEEEEKKVPTPQEKKRRKGGWGIQGRRAMVDSSLLLFCTCLHGGGWALGSLFIC